MHGSPEVSHSLKRCMAPQNPDADLRSDAVTSAQENFTRRRRRRWTGATGDFAMSKNRFLRPQTDRNESRRLIRLLSVVLIQFTAHSNHPFGFLL